MPRGDGTGPIGLGPMTGRGAGYCAGFAVPGFANFKGSRRFAGRGSGRGFGWGLGYPPASPASQVTVTPEASDGRAFSGASVSAEAALNDLSAQVELIKKTLAQMGKRIEDIAGSNRGDAE